MRRAAGTRPLTRADYVALAGFRATLRAFLRFAEQGARAAGMTPAQHQLMLAIAGDPEREFATVGGIANALGIRAHAAVGLVDRSVRAGWVRRLRSHADRRRVEVWLTPRGRRALERVSRRNRGELERLRRALDRALLERRGGSRPGGTRPPGRPRRNIGA